MIYILTVYMLIIWLTVHAYKAIQIREYKLFGKVALAYIIFIWTYFAIRTLMDAKGIW